MKIRHFWGCWLVVFVIVSLIGCRSEFEKARLSSDPEYVLEQANKYYDEGDYIKAQTLYELILSSYRGSAQAEDIYFKYAYTYYYMRQYLLAAHYFQSFANTFTYSGQREEANFMSAYSHYSMSPGFRLDQKPTKDAIAGFQEFVNTYPSSSRVEECNKLIDELRAKLEQKAFASAQLYYDIRQYDAAIRSFENMLTEFPETDRAELVQFRILESAYHYAENSVFERREERYSEAVDKYRDFIRKYPDSMYRERADKLLTQIQINLKNLYE